MAHISTLVADINNLLEKGKKIDDADYAELGKELADVVQRALLRQEDRINNSAVRVSNVGKPCLLQVWRREHEPEKATSLDGKTALKFMYGNLIETIVLFLAEQSGHNVFLRQFPVEIGDITGHIDCIIDGQLVDVKSASGYSFQKFKNHEVPKDDLFGYMAQLSLYHAGIFNLAHAEFEIDPEYASFLAVNKETGEILLDTYDGMSKLGEQWINYAENQFVPTVTQETVPLDHLQPLVPFGKSGNMQIAVPCRYCEFKSTCFPGLRTFQYSNANIHLATIVEEPKVPEIINGFASLKENFNG